MIKHFLSCLLIFLLFVCAALVYQRDDGRLDLERRLIRRFPDLPGTLSNLKIKRFFKDLGAFYTDHFPGRSLFLYAHNIVADYLDDDMNPDFGFRGKDGWLFVGNSFNRLVDRLEGRLTVSEKQVRKKLAEYSAVQKIAGSFGADFMVIIGPNKSSIYPELLPDYIFPAKTRYLEPIVKSLNEHGIPVYDPSADLRGAKAEGILYFRTDSHWNLLGSFIASKGFLRMHNRLFKPLPDLPDLELAPGPAIQGDLVYIGGYQTFPVREGDNFILKFREPFELTQHLADGEALRKPGSMQNDVYGSWVRNEHSTSDKVAWVFGDSFFVALSPYLQAIFRETHYLHIDFMNEGLKLPASKPDLIIIESVERDL